MDSGSDARAQQLIAAVHALVGQDRLLTEHELLVATASELLVDGAAPTTLIVRFVNDVWAGANVAHSRVTDALKTGAAAGLVAETSVVGKPGWALTSAGCEGAIGSKGWSEQVFARTRRELQELARDNFKELTEVEAGLFVQLLARALTDAVREAYAAYVGDLELLADGALKPAVFQREKALAALAAADIGDAAREFLEAAVIAALDATDPFGNEVIGHIATGCVLQAYLAHTFNDAHEKLGPLAGEEFVVETPLLVDLLGPSWESEPIERTIAAAIAAETSVVVPEHCIEELLELVDGVEARHLQPLTEALGQGMKARTYAAAVQQGILQSWVAALDEGRYKQWSEFRSAAAALRGNLGSLGVHVRNHGNINRDTVRRCRDSLAAEIDATGAGRAAVAIDRDAETMAMVLRHRRASTQKRLWPGSWIVTPDRRIGPAYCAVSPGDRVPLTLSRARWSTLVARCASAPSLEQLARSTAPLLVRDTALAIASGYPPDIALDLARTLSSAEDSTTIDVHVATSLEDVLDASAEGAGTRLASDVLARRARRMRGAEEIRAARDGADVRRARELADAERRSREEAEARANQDRSARVASERRADEAEERLETHQRNTEVLSGRRTRFTVSITLATVAIVVFFAAEWLVLATASSLALLVFAKQSRPWRTDVDASLISVWPAVVVELLGVIQLAWAPHW